MEKDGNVHSLSVILLVRILIENNYDLKYRTITIHQDVHPNSIYSEKELKTTIQQSFSWLFLVFLCHILFGEEEVEGDMIGKGKLVFSHLSKYILAKAVHNPHT